MVIQKGKLEPDGEPAKQGSGSGTEQDYGRHQNHLNPKTDKGSGSHPGLH